jgi:acyl-CoA synthetase (AMP-forming)/AMP-acid ligase II
MIKTGGENVYCSEIEQLLQTHGSVMEAAILGVPSLEWDEEVRAVISVREGHDLTEGEVRDFLRQRLASYKVPKVIVLVGPGQIPLNPSGKVVKSEVRTMVGW